MSLGETRSIKLPQGGMLDIDMKPELLVRIRRQFDLAKEDPVSDDHVRMFVFGAVKGGIDRHEKENPEAGS